MHGTGTWSAKLILAYNERPISLGFPILSNKWILLKLLHKTHRKITNTVRRGRTENDMAKGMDLPLKSIG